MICGKFRRTTTVSGYLIAIASIALTTFLAMPLRHVLDLANIVMLFLLVTFLIALRLGRGPAVVAAVLGVGLFDYIFVPPHLDFIPTDAQYVVMLTVMLAVALLTGQLTAGAQEQAYLACRREEQTRRLYQLARDLAGALSPWDVQRALDSYLERSGYRAVVYFASPEAGDDPPRGDGLAAGHALVLPLRIASPRSAAMVVTGQGESVPPPARERESFEVVASLLTIAVERLHTAEELQTSREDAAAERLRASILSALSHDLRTPLTALVGMADTLTTLSDSNPLPAVEKLAGIREQARSLGQMVNNLLDMARLQAGKAKPRKEWQLLDDLIGVGLRHLRACHPGVTVRVRLAPDLPLVAYDAVWMERVLGNLLENAVKFAPPGSPIEVEAWLDDKLACLAVSDHGPGFPRRDSERLFGVFERGQQESAKPGVGLGLAICRAIVEAHGGDIRAEHPVTGGARVIVRLPLGTPPDFEEEEAEPEEPRP